MFPDLLGSPRFFRYWVGYGGILYGGLSLCLAWLAGMGWLLATLALWSVWWSETSTGFCRRCTHFNCGPHGRLMKRFFARDPRPLGTVRLRIHVAGDLLVFAWAQPWIWTWPWLGVASLIWLAVAGIAALPSSSEAMRDVAKFPGRRPVLRGRGVRRGR